VPVKIPSFEPICDEEYAALFPAGPKTTAPSLVAFLADVEKRRPVRVLLVA
jgi:hypothetical protein